MSSEEPLDRAPVLFTCLAVSPDLALFPVSIRPEIDAGSAVGGDERHRGRIQLSENLEAAISRQEPSARKRKVDLLEDDEVDLINGESDRDASGAGDYGHGCEARIPDQSSDLMPRPNHPGYERGREPEEHEDAAGHAPSDELARRIHRCRLSHSASLRTEAPAGARRLSRRTIPVYAFRDKSHICDAVYRDSLLQELPDDQGDQVDGRIGDHER